MRLKSEIYEVDWMQTRLKDKTNATLKALYDMLLQTFQTLSIRF
jgi:hypothetical protein